MKQWKTPDDGQKNFSKHVEFHSKNKLERLVHLVGFIIRNNVRVEDESQRFISRLIPSPFATSAK